MNKAEFLEKAFAGKSPQIRSAAVRVLDLYLSAAVWSRDATSSDRKARLRQIIEEAARSANTGKEK